MFNKSKIGDKVWSFTHGWGIITNIIKNYKNCIVVSFNDQEETYTLEGKINDTDINPSLFWDEIKFETPKPFDLIEFLEEYVSYDLLLPGNFCHNSDNAYFFYDCDKKIICWDTHCSHYIPGVMYFALNEKVLDEIVEKANEKHISFKEFKQAFKEIHWDYVDNE